jgi:DNA replication ATP-dependent helicase Dna2
MNPVVFINTDAISTNLEVQAGSRITNALEARLVTHLTVTLRSMGIAADEIGVIAFYRSQLALLRQSLQHAHTQTQSSELAAGASALNHPAIELHTADKFQGRDKEVVLVSCVRSNDNGVVGDLLKDRRRVNVALTRARSKLIILGSEKTLSSNELLKDLVSLCREKGWVLDLQQDMVDGHAFDEGMTQTGRLSTTTTAGTSRAMNGVAKSPTPSPSKKRRALGDVTATGAANKKAALSPEKRLKSSQKMPGKVFRAGKKGVLDGRPILRNIFEEAT